ncbi:MAG: TonB-dependent receptor [Bacteroidales bacterium]|nr:TonB-dependent receptor [Bacteroidales bacterium]
MKFSHLFKSLAIGILLACMLYPASGQTLVRSLSGRITDSEGEPLAGASIRIKGVTGGFIADLDGNYEIRDLRVPATLIVSFIGYKDCEISVDANTKSPFAIVLDDSNTVLDDVVVVGYATMKKRDLVGAVDQVDSKVVGDRSNGDLGRSLQGEIAGLNITFNDGKPSSGASVNVRGSTSIGAGGSTLILIDGVEGSLDLVNPSDVESVSVLKDASSTAVYGARGAFGVILVTTKSAKKGTPVINYSGSVSMKKRTVDFHNITDSIEWLDWWKTCYNNYYNGSRALLNHIDSKAPYSEDIYNEIIRRNQDPSLSKVVESYDVAGFGYAYYDNTDWMNEFYKTWSSSTEHNLSVSGGNENADYYISGRYYGADGIYKVGAENYHRYNLRAKGTLKVRPWLKITNNLSVSVADDLQPRTQNGTVVQKYMQHCLQPMAPLRNPDGSWTPAAAISGYAAFYEGNNYLTDNRTWLREKISADIDLIKDRLKLQADYSYNFTDRNRRTIQNTVTYSKSPGVFLEESASAGDKLTEVNYDTRYQASNIYLTWSPKLGRKHSLTTLAGWNVEWQTYKTLTASRTGFTSNKPSFTLMDGEASITAGGNAWSYVGAFARVNYSFLGKYLLEVSGRYDGSSKFPTYSQWGFFPSASAAWRISDESWMRWSRDWMDNLKLRVSAGSMGNGNVSPYLYTSEMSVTKATDIVLGGSLPSYTSVGSVVPVSLTWERSTTYDLGLDFDLLSSRLSFSGDYYHRYTTDMYTLSATVPSVYGTSSPKGNNAEMLTRGWELSLQWRDEFALAGKPFSYSIKGLLWDSRSFITKYAGNDENKIAASMSNLIANGGNPSNFYEGMEIGEIWGYTVEGLFKDYEDIANSAVHSFQQASDKVTRPGMVKVKDIGGKFDENGNYVPDGIIDYGQLTTDQPGDLKIIGNSSARYNYGINISTKWNGIGLSVFLQGVAKRDWYPGDDCGYFWGKYSRPFFYFIPTAHRLSNPTVAQLNEDGTECLNWDSAYWPRVSTYQSNGDDAATKILEIANTRYLQNAAFLRVKNVQIDYSFGDKVCRALGVKGLRVYLNGENLFTFTPLHKWAENLDPEGLGYDTDFNSAAQGNTYPVFKTLTAGFNVTF